MKFVLTINLTVSNRGQWMAWTPSDHGWEQHSEWCCSKSEAMAQSLAKFHELLSPEWKVNFSVERLPACIII
jgi:hypothetical protein